MQRACAVLSSAVSLAPPHFSTLPDKRHNFQKIVTTHRMCVLIFSTTFLWNISHSKKNSAVYCYKCENVFMWGPAILDGFQWSLNVLDSCLEKAQMLSLTKIRPVGDELFHADGQTDKHDDANSCYRNFADVPNKKRTFERARYCRTPCSAAWSTRKLHAVKHKCRTMLSWHHRRWSGIVEG